MKILIILQPLLNTDLIALRIKCKALCVIEHVLHDLTTVYSSATE